LDEARLPALTTAPATSHTTIADALMVTIPTTGRSALGTRPSTIDVRAPMSPAVANPRPITELF
jgi:hypothetical protein